MVKYEMLYRTLKGIIGRALDIREAHAKARGLVSEQAKLIEFRCLFCPNLIKWQSIAWCRLWLYDVDYSIETGHIIKHLLSMGKD